MAKKENSFAKDVMTLAAGTASAHVIGLIAMPVLARLYSPADFGALAVFAAAVGPISIISTWRYDLAILLPEKDEDASHIVWLCMALLTAMSALAALIVIFIGPKLWPLLHTPVLGIYGWLIPANIFITGVSTILTSWNTRKKQFSRLMMLQVITRIAITLSQFVIAISGFAGAGALMITTVFGTLLATLVLCVQTWRDSGEVLGNGISRLPLYLAAKEYYQFPRYNVPAAVMNSISQYLPAAMLSAFFSVPTAGQFSFGTRLLRLPSALVGTNVGKAFYPRATEAVENGTLGIRVEQTLTYLVKLTAFPCLLLALVGKDLFIVFLGSRWAEAGVFCQMLSFWLFLWFISSPLYSVFLVLQEQALELKFQVANLITRFAALLIGGLLGNARLAVGLFAAAGVLVYGAYSAAIMIKSHAHPRVILKPLLSTVGAFLPAALILELIRYYTGSRVAVVVVCFLLLAGWLSNLFRTEPQARAMFTRLGQKLFPARAHSM
jgi:O-antigen/teichoic acid export membrane protein